MNVSLFSETPMVTVINNRGARVRDIAFHRHPSTPYIADVRITRHRYNARSALTQSADPRLHDAGLANFTYISNLADTVVLRQGADNGTAVSLFDAAGRPFLAVTHIVSDDDNKWKKDESVSRTWQYEDASLAGRLLSIMEHAAGDVPRIAERFTYASSGDREKALNLAGVCVSHYDTAGLIHCDRVALTGGPRSVTRRLLKDVDDVGTVADWLGSDTNAWNELLSDESLNTLTTTDATGAELITVDARGNTQCVVYDRSGFLSSSWLVPKDSSVQRIVVSLTYAASGLKLREEHGNGVVTAYGYEPQTQRLIGIKTERPAGHASGAKVLQDLRYRYDPVGNVLSIRDDAEEIRFWRNQKVAPENTYTYDSLYQLVCATGREMAGIGRQTSRLPCATVPIPVDNSAYTCYARSYCYDEAGNLTQVRHSPATGSGYTAIYTVSDRSNRAVMSTLTTNPTEVEGLFTAGGQQRQLQPGQALMWTPRGELLQVTAVERGLDTSDTEHYRYDGARQRILKTSVQMAAHCAHRQHVLYLPRLELRTKKSGELETERLQVITLGEAGRAQVRMLHWENGRPEAIDNDQTRWSYDNLTASGGLELDGAGKVLSREEYYPYGGTAILNARSQTEVSYKTVRFSGKERDQTGLYCFGVRYYQPWACRWLSADPAGTVDGLNLFRMCWNNPVTKRDIDGCISSDFNSLKDLIERQPPEVERKVVLGMALTQYLLEFGIKAKLGGSLVAKLYGADRAPKDIDIDIGSADGEAINTSRYKAKIRLLEKKYISTGKSLVSIESVAERSGVLHIAHKIVTTDTLQDIDPFDEDDQASVDVNLFTDATMYEDIVDIGTFDIFGVAGLVLGTDPTPHVEPELLIAGFLSRMDEDKADSQQSLALIEHLTSRGKKPPEIETGVMSHFDHGHSNFQKLRGRLTSALSRRFGTN